MSEKLTIREVAKLADCSYATVSRALNGRRGVHPDTYARIMQVVEQSGFRPNQFARGLVNKKSYTIAIIVPDIKNPFFAEIIASVETVVSARGYQLIVSTGNWDTKTERYKLKLMEENHVDGIIFKPGFEDDRVYESIKVPFISLSKIENGKFSYVEVDNVAGAYEATQYLISRGYKRIAMIAGPTKSRTSCHRVEGFLTALKDHDIPLIQNYLIHVEYTLESGYEGMDKLLKVAVPPDAVVCINDMVAIGVQQRIIEAKMNIPNEIGIIGFDNIYLSSIPQTRLTTMAQPLSEIGEIAAKMLLDQLEEKSKSVAQKILLSSELIIRSTTR